LDDLHYLISRHGLALIFANVLLDQLGLPTPAIPALVVAGALAADGRISAPWVFVIAFTATMLADITWFVAGRRYGGRVMKGLCWASLTPDSCVSQTQTLFERWGTKSLVVANFIPGFATIASPLAGAAGIGWLRFLLFSALGAFLWISAGMGTGLLFAAQLDQLLSELGSVGATALPIVGALLAAWVAYKWWERYRFLTMLRMARIDVHELYGLMNAGEAPLVVDVRTQTARTLEPRTIPGALHVPLGAVGQHVKDLPRDRDIILYCTCPNEVSAAEAAKLLMNGGFTRVRPLHGGLDAWIAAGYEVEPLREYI
jgi:membrane protein DedA with SNARE-associated domain/rhodanese-related sulfurtransferase